MTTETKDFPITYAALPNLTRRVSIDTQEERMVKAHKLGVADYKAGKPLDKRDLKASEAIAYAAGYRGAQKRSNFIRQGGQQSINH